MLIIFFAEVEEDFRHPGLIHSSGQLMELDVYVEDFKLAFEYQGEQHYIQSNWMNKDFSQRKIIDNEKKIACKQVN